MVGLLAVYRTVPGVDISKIQPKSAMMTMIRKGVVSQVFIFPPMKALAPTLAVKIPTTPFAPNYTSTVAVIQEL